MVISNQYIYIYIYIYINHHESIFTSTKTVFRFPFFQTKKEARRGGQESREREGRGGEGRIQEAG